MAGEAPRNNFLGSVLKAIKSTVTTKNPLISDLSRVGHTEGQPQTSSHEFDVIIIGGGTAGCVLASRLSEDPSIRVLVLESGGSGVALLESRIPIGNGKLTHTKHDWNNYTEPQVGSYGQTKYWPAGRALGGSSSMNAMILHCGSPEDYDEWARLNSDPGAEIWSYKNFRKYFLKFEKYISNEKYPGPSIDPSLHGSDGPMKVGYFGHFSEIAARFIQSCAALGMTHLPDLNTPKGTLGASKTMTFIDPRGQRVSAESAYLTPEVLNRPNLKVAIHAQVTRIMFEKADGITKAVGVEFANTEKGPRFRAIARKQVIVSAGAVRTPQVLMLSGVGPAEELKRHSIPLVHDLPGVGSHLMDHIVVDVRYRDKSRTALRLNTPTLWDHLRVTMYTFQWMLFGTGPLSTNLGEAVSFVRSTDQKLFLTDETPSAPEDTTSGPGAPDIEYFIAPMAYTEHGTGPIPAGYLWSLHEILLRPTSIGTITLKSTNPFEAPSIDPKYLSTEHDVDVLVRGMKLLFRIAKTSPLKEALDDTEKDGFLDQELHKLDDKELAEVVKKRVETAYHPCSTARMAPLKDGGVVDPHLRVHGISNLRVVDASVFPMIIAGHTAGPVLAVAEQAADLIKNEIGAKN